MFSAPILNGFRFANQNPTYDPRYNKLPFDELVDQNSYAQKWQTNDVVPIQIISDFVPTFDIYNCADEFVANIPLNPAPNGIKDQTFLVYEGEVDFNGYDEDFYYGKLTYTDENSVLQDFRTSPLDVATLHAGTSLIQYKNSQNDKGVVFDTGIEFCFRIESNFDEFQPKAKTAQYEDQKYNSMVLNSIPYRTSVLYFGSTDTIGDSTLLPNWVADKLNVIFTCDQVRVDGEYYTRLDSGDLKPYRAGNSFPNDGYWSLEVQHVPNFDLRKYVSGDTPTGDLRVVRDAIKRENVSAGFNVPGLFTDNMALVSISVWNYNLDNFIIRLGTALNSSNIAEFEVKANLTNLFDVGEVFNSATTVYVSFTDLAGNIITGVNLKIWFVFDDYSAPVLNNPAGGGNGLFPKGFVGHYKYQDIADLTIDWNIATGMGNAGTRWSNCKILSITDEAGLYIQSWDGVDVNDLNTITGNEDNLLTLLKANLPAEGIQLFVNQFNGATNQKPTNEQPVAITGASGSIGYELERATGEPNIGLSGKLGEGQPIEIAPRSIILLTFEAITD